MGAADGCDTPSYSSCQPCYTSLLHRGELSQSQTPILLLCLSQTIKEIVIPQIKPYSHCTQLCCSARNAREANQIHRCIRTTTAPQSQPPLPFYIAVLAPHHFGLLEPFRVAKTKASSSTQQQLSPGSKLSRKLPGITAWLSLHHVSAFTFLQHSSLLQEGVLLGSIFPARSHSSRELHMFIMDFLLLLWCQQKRFSNQPHGLS